MEQAGIRVHVRGVGPRSAELPAVVQTDRTDRGADAQAEPRAVPHIVVPRSVPEAEDLFWFDVLGALPDVPPVEEKGPGEDPEERESELGRGQELDLAAPDHAVDRIDPRGGGRVHLPGPELVLVVAPDGGGASRAVAVLGGNLGELQ